MADLSAVVVPLVVALIASVVPLLAVIVSHRGQSKATQEIHVLVNSRLSEALDEINSLKDTLARKDVVIAEQDKDRGA